MVGGAILHREGVKIANAQHRMRLKMIKMFALPLKLLVRNRQDGGITNPNEENRLSPCGLKFGSNSRAPRVRLGNPMGLLYFMHLSFMISLNQ